MRAGMETMSDDKFSDDELREKLRSLLVQAAVEGTLILSESRRTAIELAMKYLGMLNQKERSDQPKDRETVEALLSSFTDPSRHTLHDTTNREPGEVERFLREKSGVHLAKKESPATVRAKYRRNVKRNV